MQGMAVFLITPLDNNFEELGLSIGDKFPKGDSYPLVHNAGWLVYHKGTSVEVSADIGITGTPPGEKPEVGAALVTPITSYYGMGPTDMWEWLKSRFERR